MSSLAGQNPECYLSELSIWARCPTFVHRLFPETAHHIIGHAPPVNPAGTSTTPFYSLEAFSHHPDGVSHLIKLVHDFTITDEDGRLSPHDLRVVSGIMPAKLDVVVGLLAWAKLLVYEQIVINIFFRVLQHPSSEDVKSPFF